MKTAESAKPPTTVNDEDIQAIIRENEAGVGDLMEAYLRFEEHYFAAATRSKAPRPLAYSTNTSGE